MKDGSWHERATPHDGVTRCPVCGAALDARLLDLENEDAASRETLLLLDCPRGHVHATLTRDDIMTVLRAEVLERLRVLAVLTTGRLDDAALPSLDGSLRA